MLFGFIFFQHFRFHRQPFCSRGNRFCSAPVGVKINSAVQAGMFHRWTRPGLALGIFTF